jgi:hypothetical protein
LRIGISGVAHGKREIDVVAEKRWATLRTDNSVVTTVTTHDADKQLSKGMKQAHTSMDATKAHLVLPAKGAEKLGWNRGARVVAAKRDAFSKLPAASKAVADR